MQTGPFGSMPYVGGDNMPGTRFSQNVPCAAPRCAAHATVWVEDDRFEQFAECERAGAWFCRSCSWKPKCGLDDSAFIVPPTLSWDSWAFLEVVQNAVEGHE